MLTRTGSSSTCRMELARGKRKETWLKGWRQTKDIVDEKICEGMFSQAEKTSVHGRRGGRGERAALTADQPFGRSLTHWVDDALKSLEAIVHRKHMVLTVCNPSQLRTDRRMYRGVSGMDVKLRKVMPCCTGLGYLCSEPRGTWSLHQA